jgi:alkylation response protein AidB-like acyl-CoA dehydrogenase
MIFDLNDAQHEFARVLHHALPAMLSHTRLTEIIDADDDLDAASWRCLVETGVLGLAAPPEHAGAGAGVLTLAVAAEEAGYAAVPGGYLGQLLAVLALTEGGDEEQQRRWLPELVTGRRRATVAITGHDRAMAAGHGLTGNVPFVLGLPTADLIVVNTTTGLSLVDVAAAAGVRPVAGVDRTRRLWSLTLDGVAHQPLRGGPALAGRILDTARVLLAADAHGGARRCLDLAVAHVRQREQFGVPIGRFQAVRHQLADLATQIEPGRGLYWLAAHQLDAGDERAGTSAALAKAHLTEVFVGAVRQCVRLHGALGYTWDGPVHPWLGRALFDQALYGTPRQLRAVVATDLGWA